MSHRISAQQLGLGGRHPVSPPRGLQRRRSVAPHVTFFCSNLSNVDPRKECWSECHQTHFCDMLCRPAAGSNVPFRSVGRLLSVSGDSIRTETERTYVTPSPWGFILPKRVSQPGWVRSSWRETCTDSFQRGPVRSQSGRWLRCVDTQRGCGTS